MDAKTHQSQLLPEDNKFHAGNRGDGKHYWLTPPEVYEPLNAEFSFDFDPCPYPLPEGFDGLTQPWGQSSYVNPPFGSIVHEGKKKGPTAWARKAITEAEQGKRVVLVYPIDKWVLMLLQAGAEVRNLGDVKWLATEDGSQGKGTGRHIAAFIFNPPKESAPSEQVAATYSLDADPLRIRERAADAITGALILGSRNTDPPPAGHWLVPFWGMARAEAALRESQVAASVAVPEGLPADLAAAVALDDRAWALSKQAEEAGAERCEDENSTSWILRIEHFKALAAAPVAPEREG